MSDQPCATPAGITEISPTPTLRATKSPTICAAAGRTVQDLGHFAVRGPSADHSGSGRRHQSAGTGDDDIGLDRIVMGNAAAGGRLGIGRQSRHATRDRVGRRAAAPRPPGARRSDRVSPPRRKADTCPDPARAACDRRSADDASKPCRCADFGNVGGGILLRERDRDVVSKAAAATIALCIRPSLDDY